MKKGFTVIELLAIIIILSIIALITVPVVANVIKNSQKKAAIDQAYIYIDAVESNTGLGSLDSTSGYLELEDTCYNVVSGGLQKPGSEEVLKLKIKGTPPSDGIICIEKNKVRRAIISTNGYRVTTLNGEVTGVAKIKSSDDMRLDLLYNNVKVGDYIKMTPSPDTNSYEDVYGPGSALTEGKHTYSFSASGTLKKGYKIKKEQTGISIDQVIDPTELNLWRVIRINDDNSIDVVSEYTSSDLVWFAAETGYKNYVGVLNEIASQYENDDYTTGSRIIGYKEGCQTEFLSSFEADSNTPETSDNEYESIGGGDICYKEDLDLIYNAVGKYSAYMKGTKTMSTYYIGSRYFKPNDNLYLYYNWDIPAHNKIITGDFASYGYIRPIITIDGTLTGFNGDGTSSSPFVLQ